MYIYVCIYRISPYAIYAVYQYTSLHISYIDLYSLCAV